MRILVVSPEFSVEADGSYRPGGLAVFARTFARALATIDEVDTLAVWGLLDDQLAMETTFARYLEGAQHPQLETETKGFGGSRPRMAWRFFREQSNYDLVIFMHLGVARLANLMFGRRHAHWLIGIEVRHKLRWFERRAVAQADPLLSISDFTTETMEALNPDLTGAQTVHLCVEPDEAWGAPSETAQAPYDAKHRAPAVLIVGRMSAQEAYKGHDALIEAWPRVRARVPDAELWIVGPGDDVPRLKQLAQQQQGDAREAIRFLGKVSHTELLKRYSECRVFAMPSLGEGFGLVFVEAMRKGMPCICSHDSAQEIVVDGETGFVVPQSSEEVAQACVRLLEDDALANRMARAGQQRFNELYTFEAFTARVRAALGLRSQEIANAPQRRAG